MFNTNTNTTPNQTFNFVKVQPPLWKQIISRPFRSYGRMAGITFGLAAVGNVIASVANVGKTKDWEPRKMMFEHPQIYSFSLLCTSAYFGVLWPAFYIQACTKPTELFNTWKSSKYVIDVVDHDDFEKSVEKLMDELIK